jgi:hypothetical protein
VVSLTNPNIETKRRVKALTNQKAVEAYEVKKKRCDSSKNDDIEK